MNQNGVSMASLMPGTFTNQVVLVTGGTAGIGQAAAITFARLGAQVVVNGRSVERGQETVQMIEQVGGKATFFQADIAHANEVESLINFSVEKYGHLDCAFNNAGLEGTIAPITDLTVDEWHQVIEANLTGTWLCLKYEITQMLTQGHGVIVNTSSALGQVSRANVSPYSASKHGVDGLTRSLAIEYATKGIRINAISPGPIATAMATRVIDPEWMKLFVPLGRMGTSQEAANVAVWLCSEAASFMIGAVVAVDGGRLAL